MSAVAVPPAVRAIKEQVAAEWRITLADLDSRSRTDQIAHARHEAMFRIRNELAGKSFPWIGRQFGQPYFDHTSVRHGINGHARRVREGTLKKPGTIR